MFLSFEVGPDRGLERASCTAVPRLMIIGGPNGSGKSTMLELLHRNSGQAESGTRHVCVAILPCGRYWWSCQPNPVDVKRLVGRPRRIGANQLTLGADNRNLGKCLLRKQVQGWCE
jgi:ABC-type Mn2+/Zn2+ transport system ATPase subunit